MKQILMSKEEYDQLMQDFENLKKEKESLVEKNADKDKEIEKLEEVIIKVKGHANYLNQITIKNPVLDVNKCIEELKQQAYGYYKGIRFNDEFQRKDEYEQVVCFLNGVDLRFINDSLTYEETTSYEWGLNSELLNGTLLDSKIKETQEQRFKIYELEQERDSLKKQIKENDKSFYKINEERRKQGIKLLESKNNYDSLLERYRRAEQDCINYLSEIETLNGKIEQYENERHYCIKLPEWVMKLLRRKQ